GGEVEYTDLPVGHRLVVTSDIDPSQPTRITNLGAYHAHLLEQAPDRIVMLHQQQQEQIDRSLKVSPTSMDDETPDASGDAVPAGREACEQAGWTAGAAAESAAQDAETASIAASVAGNAAESVRPAIKQPGDVGCTGDF